MPTGAGCHLHDDVFIAELFSKEYQRLVRYAQIIFRKRGGYVDPVGRAEEIVQEAFYLACEKKRNELLQSDDPGRWLTATVTHKISEALKEDRKWVRGLMLLPSEEASEPFPEQGELAEFIPEEDYNLLRKLYVEGYTYKELCGEMGINKSNLGMRVNRIKKRFREKYEKIFI